MSEYNTIFNFSKKKEHSEECSFSINLQFFYIPNSVRISFNAAFACSVFMYVNGNPKR